MISTWCEPLDRADAYVRPADIPVALKYFRETLGDIKKLFFNPMYLDEKHKHYRSLDYTFPEDIEVIQHAGVAGWEIRAEGGKVRDLPKSEKVVIPINEKQFAVAVVEDISPKTILPPAAVVLTPPAKRQDKKDTNSTTAGVKNHQTRIMQRPDFDCSAPSKVNAPKKRIMQHQKSIIRHGILGRPEKRGEVHRSTLCRRRKKLEQQKEQGRLAI